MPPIGPKLKNDGPACRVCGCTEHNACPMPETIRGIPFEGCSWVQTRGGADAGPLCSACSGAAADAYEVMHRIDDLLALKRHSAVNLTAARDIARAFQARYRRRQKEVAAVE